jgi:two-component system NtrC family response regulator
VRLLEERRLKRELTTLKADLYQRYKFGAIIGKHPKMIKIYALIESLRDMDSSVLITGETGTGKDITARAIHFESHRRNGPFVAINCASVPETLLESELFGYERGAFTGAARRKYGKIEQAHGGTLFLDEIGDMPYPLQSKLLRTMQDKQIERLGSNKSISLDFRIISATNKDLPHELAEKRFRLDLFYRISVAPIHLPPLRERPEDIPLLVDHFLEKLAEKMNRARSELSPKAMADLMNHHWPGNVRELENVLELAIILNPNRMIEDVPISPLYSPDACETARPAFGIDTGMALKELKDHVLAHVEREYFTELLKKNRGSIARTASDAQIDVRTVLRKIRQYGLSKADYK